MQRETRSKKASGSKEQGEPVPVQEGDKDPGPEQVREDDSASGSEHETGNVETDDQVSARKTTRMGEDPMKALFQMLEKISSEVKEMRETYGGNLNPRISELDAALSGDSSQGLGGEADTTRRLIDVTDRQAPGARERVLASAGHAEGGPGHSGGVSASEARGRAARAEEPQIAGVLKDLVVPFDPERSEGAKIWMQRLEQYLGVINLQGIEARKMYLFTKLKGRAVLWFESTGERLHSWEEVRQSFLDEFVDAMSVERSWYTLSRVRDQSTFQRYWREFERTARLTEEDVWTHERIRGSFYFNLCGRRKERLLAHALTLGQKVESLSLKTMVDILSYMELAYAGEHQESRGSTTREPRTTRDSREGKAPRNENGSREGKASRDSKPLQNTKGCFTCGKTDHWKRDCPQRKAKVAAIAEADQDIDRDDEKPPELCRIYAADIFPSQENVADIKPLQLILEADQQLNKRALRRNARTSVEEISKQFERKQEMVVDIRIGGQMVKALVDTGATGSCISTALATKINLQVTGKPATAMLADQSEMKIHGTAEAQIEALGKQISAVLMVCELGNRSSPVILGRNVLRNIGVVITLDKDGEEIIQLEGYQKWDNTDEEEEREEEQVNVEEIAATEAVISEQMETQKEKSSVNTKELPEEFGEYADVFGPLPDSPPPERPKYDLRIDLEGPLPNPVRQYRLTTQEREELHKQVQELKASGLIQSSQSSFSSPVLFVPKKTGDKRMCVDFRRLNAVTKSVGNSLPLIEDILDNLQGKTTFTTLDLRSGYWQLGVERESRKLTAFQADGETYEWNVVPFGLKNAPTIFQQFMKAVVKGISSAHVYLDDIVIASTTREENIREVGQVLQRMREYNLRCKLEKCDFFKEEIDYLGHRVTANGLQVQAAKVKAIEQGQRPSNVQSLRSFLGLTGYYRRFIERYGELAQPLTDLLRKGVVFKWCQAQEQAYQELKKRISTAPVLALPDPKKGFVLTTDASDKGLGAVLTQDGRPIAYFSKRLNPAQSRYTTGEKELMAIITALDHFRHLVDGQRTVVETDHKNLVSALSRSKLNSRSIRAIAYLQQYDVVLRYIDGKSNQVADHLSRYPIAISSLAIFELSNQNFEDIVRETEGDEEAIDLVQRKQGEKKNGIVYVSDRAFVPVGLRTRIIAAHHDGAHAGHRGVQTTMERIKRSFIWPDLEADVREFVGRCETCQTTKANNIKPLGNTKPLELPTKRFEQVSIDFVTKLPMTSQQKDSICVIVDTATKYAAFIPMKSTDTAHKVADSVLEQWVLKGFGLPRQIISDRDPKFTSSLWRELMQRLGVRLKMSASHHPQTDGQTERTIRTLNEYLRAYVAVSGKNWVKFVSFAEFAYNDSVNLTGYSPYQLLHGQNPELPWQMIIPGKSQVETVNEFCRRMQKNIGRALYVLERSRMKTAQRMDQKRRPGEYKVGEQVYVNTRLFKSTLPGVARFKPAYIGPFTITRKLGNSYQVDLNGGYGLHPVFNTTELKRKTED